jgi:hypothetical protein
MPPHCFAAAQQQEPSSNFFKKCKSSRFIRTDRRENKKPPPSNKQTNKHAYFRFYIYRYIMILLSLIQGKGGCDCRDMQHAWGNL